MSDHHVLPYSVQVYWENALCEFKRVFREFDGFLCGLLIFVQNINKATYKINYDLSIYFYLTTNPF